MSEVKQLPSEYGRLGVNPSEEGSVIAQEGVAPDDNSFIMVDDSANHGLIVRTGKYRKQPDHFRIIDWNMCFYACLTQFILANPFKFMQRSNNLFTKIGITYKDFIKDCKLETQKGLVMLRLKSLATRDLQFSIVPGMDGPMKTGGAVDDRVIQAVSQLLRITIVILKSGSALYVSNPGQELTVCLFLNKFHYQLVSGEQDRHNMITLAECSPDTIGPVFKEMKRSQKPKK